MTSKEIKPNTKDVIESIDTVITIMERFGNMNALGGIGLIKDKILDHYDSNLEIYQDVKKVYTSTKKLIDNNSSSQPNLCGLVLELTEVRDKYSKYRTAEKV